LWCGVEYIRQLEVRRVTSLTSYVFFFLWFETGPFVVVCVVGLAFLFFDSPFSLLAVFEEAWVFNQDVSKWDVSQVTTFENMFFETNAFNQGTWCNPSWNKQAAVVDLPNTNQLRNRIFCCDPGSSLNGTDPLAKTGASWTLQTCPECPAGQYTDSLNLNVFCTRCPRNEIAPVDGLSKCGPCQGGAFSNDGIACEICPAGKKTSKGADTTTCAPCHSGFYQDMAGNTTCAQCPSGYVQNEDNKPFCLPCIPGKISHANRTTCSKCLSGMYQGTQAQASCNNCSAGKVMPVAGAAKCVDCIPGQFQDEGGEQQCKDCLAGQHRLNTINDTNLTTCVDCPIGKSMPLKAAAKCIDCIPGQFQNEKGKHHCKNCLAGQHRLNTINNTNLTTCVDCPIGFSQSDEGQASCVKCSPGEFNDVVGAVKCKCNVLWWQRKRPQLHRLSNGLVVRRRQCQMCRVRCRHVRHWV
jgi:hypothetical protein